MQTGRNLQCRCVSPGFARKIYGIQCLRQCRCVSRSSFQCPVSQSGVRAHVTCNDCMHQATVKNQAGARSSGLRSISFQFPAPNIIRLTEVWAPGCSLASPARSCSLHPTGTLGGRKSCSLHPTGTLGPCKKLQFASNAIWPALQEVARV